MDRGKSGAAESGAIKVAKHEVGRACRWCGAALLAHRGRVSRCASMVQPLAQGQADRQDGGARDCGRSWRGGGQEGIDRGMSRFFASRTHRQVAGGRRAAFQVGWAIWGAGRSGLGPWGARDKRRRVGEGIRLAARTLVGFELVEGGRGGRDGAARK
ncbi:uncharacterized protein K452DRAFT_50088 [Aplosporella prunicola CBS 121167]|uniref:Uncharacterized protein n=1 Tax=Aplosporella prunicola CBS 121167 TaxID=1176127 RepID=A0A6A6BDX8_9PEZI|nr:uncharacterized protein K452DRAFT_50088 [Aplosporella prunicola CBS 121167]KAF2140691.1 hypothetical protein K452DRAFT_50088 [Aplosporella prunicola CBS 121167]